MKKVMTFQNHAPINYENADIETAWSAYQNFGHHDIDVIIGKRLHIYDTCNSGCTYNGHEPSTTRTYLFGAKTKEEVIAWVLGLEGEDVLTQNQKNDLLLWAGYIGEEA